MVGSSGGPSDEQKWALVEQLLRGEVSAVEVRERHALSDADLAAWVQGFRDAARQAIDEQMESALARQGLAFDAHRQGEISGRVEGMAIAELIQTLAYGRRDALIRIEHHDRESRIWVRDGEVIDARSGALAGAAAVYRLLGLREGRFRATLGSIERERAIEASTQALLIESAQRFDECRALREQLGDTELEHVAAVAGDTRGLEPVERELLERFGQGASLEQVLRGSRFADLEALAALVKLRQRGLLLPKSRSEPTVATSVPASRRSSVELSVSPLAASLRAGRRELGAAPRGRAWASALAGIAVVSAAFAVGFASARTEVKSAAGARPIVVPSLSAESAARCPDGMASVSVGPLVRAGIRDPLATAGDRAAGRGAFCMSRSAVSVNAYAECVSAGACTAAADEPPGAGSEAPAAFEGDGAERSCNSRRPGHELDAMNCVSAQQAEQYCRFRGARLPSAAEWARAAETEPSLGLGSGLAEWTADRIGVVSGGEVPSAKPPPWHAILGGSSSEGQLARSYLAATSHAGHVGFRCVSAETPSATPGVAR